MMIILHSLCKHGLLFKRNRQGVRPEPGEWDGGKILNTEIIFQSKKAKGDYRRLPREYRDLYRIWTVTVGGDGIFSCNSQWSYDF